MSSEEVFKLITDKQMLACNQNGVMGKLAYRTEQVDVWLTSHRETEDAGWFGLFNRTESPWQGELKLQQIGIGQDSKLWDIWLDCPVNISGGVLTSALDADDVMFVRYERY